MNEYIFASLIPNTSIEGHRELLPVFWSAVEGWTPDVNDREIVVVHPLELIMGQWQPYNPFFDTFAIRPSAIPQFYQEAKAFLN